MNRHRHCNLAIEPASAEAPAVDGDFLPTAGWDNLRLRAALLRQVRGFFDQHGFLEVETPILSADTVVDLHLDPFQTRVPAEPGCPARRLWLQTSPEFGMKRLLAAGATAIYQITRAFRLGEQGPLHNPEFTMVEWYRAGDGMAEGMQLTSDLCEAVLGRGPAQRLTYAEAFRQHVGIDPHRVDARALCRAGQDLGLVPPRGLSLDDRGDWLDWLLVERVQSQLGISRPVILYDYPVSQAALARIHATDPPVAERFELYVSGIELANGYYELTDPAELRRRARRANALRRQQGKPPLPERSRLLAAMESGLPPSVGVALGFDRLAMVAAGAPSLREVMAFPFDRA